MDEKEKELSLADIFSLLLSKIWFILIVAVLGLMVAFCISKFVMPVKYSSSVSMYVKSNANKGEQQNVNISEINASKSLVETYIVVLKNTSVVKEVSNELVGNVEDEKLKKCFSITKEGTIDPKSIVSCLTMASVNNTEVLQLTATTKDPEVSAALCNAYSKVAPSVLIRVVGAGSVETIGNAEANYSP
ncbi:MAG: lipopolysaccharide biosynthesis, partial [Ruminococcus sp.]|nr:lipopolysaccharide biosynthesis [Ruminococcus sp.]